MRAPGGQCSGLIFGALFWLTIAAVAATKTDIDNDRRNKR